MNPVSVLSFTQVKNNDLIARLAINDALPQAKPGQYVNCALEKNAKFFLPAYVFVVNRAAAYIEIYIRQAQTKKMGLGLGLSVGSDDSPDVLFVSEPSGEFFVLPENEIKPLLIADETGLPSIIYLAEQIKQGCKIQPLVLLFSGSIYPFTPIPSQFVVSDFPAAVLAACPMLEDKKIPSRLICENFLPGCYEGSLSDFLAELPDAFFSAATMEVFAMGEKNMLENVRQFSLRRGLNFQVLLSL